MSRRCVLVWCVAVMCVSVPKPGHAQPVGRRVTTLEAITTSPIFFHGEEVVVHAEADAEGVLVYLVSGDQRLLTLDVPRPPTGTREHLEVVGTFYDVGRLEPNDPRTADLPFERLANALLNKSWPGTGELPLIVATTSRVVAEVPAATLRTIALNPSSYLDTSIAVTGRFRGRNLYADLPDSPGKSRWDFVLASADAAVWVTGKEPKGDGFELDIQARIDTGRWLNVSGSVAIYKGMVVIDAATISLADPPDAPARRPAPRQTRQGPPPEVIFSAPLPDDTDVPSDTTVRLQFSRDMDPDSFEGHVVVSYADAGRTAVAAPATEDITFDIVYRARNRVLEIRFDQELERFRTLDVQLDEGISATDGAHLAPWTLSFFTGG